MKAPARRSLLRLIKALPFLDAAARLMGAAGRELPQVNRKGLCPLPDHDEQSPSWHLYADHWFCFGCRKGGRTIELAAGLWQLDTRSDLQTILERLGELFDLGPQDELRQLARAVRLSDGIAVETPWRDQLDLVEDRLWGRMRPLAHSPDGIVRQAIEGPMGEIFEELSTSRWGLPPGTQRGRREALRRLELEAIDLVEDVEAQVTRMTGRDRLDLALMAPSPPPRPESEHRVVMALLKYLSRKRARRVADPQFRRAFEAY